MNVALLIDTLVGGGAEGVVQRIACGLARRGHRPFVYCLKNAGLPLTPLRAEGVVVREARSVGRDPLLAWRLARWFHTDHIDVAHAHSCAAFVWALPAARLRAAPLIHVRHGSLLGRPTLYRRLADRLDTLADRIVVVSEMDRARLWAGRRARDAVRIANGVDLEPLAPGVSRKLLEELSARPLAGSVVLGVGTICVEKDICGLLRACDILRRDVPDASLVWVGPERGADYAARVRRERDALNLRDSVIFAGPLKDAWRLMAGADVFCLSSATEASPNVIVEAMSQRVPIVATAVGDVGSISPKRADRTMLRHRESALLVPPQDPQALAEALRDALIDRSAARERAVRAAEDYARFHTAAEMVRRYEQVYVECIRRRSGASMHRAYRFRAPAKPGVLMVGPSPDQIGGMTSVIDALMTSSLREKYTLGRFVPSPGTSAGCNGSRCGGFSRVRHMLSAVARHVGDLCRLAREVRCERIAIVHIHTCSFVSFYRSLLDLAVAKLLGCRAYLHIHGAKFDVFCAGSRRLGRRLIRHGCEAADGVILLSRQWVETLRSYLGTARTVAIPNGVQPEPTRPERSPHTDGVCRFLFLGALVERKGVAELIDAAATIRRAGAPFELLLTGPATDRDHERWRRAVQSNGLDRVVRFTGPVQGSAKTEALASADCFVLPSHNEGLPVAILEAATAGLPVISTTVGSIPEFMTPDRSADAAVDGYLSPLVPPGDVDALAREMTRLARDPALRRKIGRRLREHAATNYSVARQAERIARLYETRSRTANRARAGSDACSAGASRSASEWIAGHLTYPLHEVLRGRRTLRCFREMGRLTAETDDVIKRECDARLRELLRFVARSLPYYRRLSATREVNPDAADPQAELAKLPVLEKAEIRAHAKQMVFRDVPGGLFPCGSGGTSGDTLRFFIDRARQAQPLGCRLFMQGLFGVRPGDRRVYLWGSPIEAEASRFERWRDRLINELVLNAFDMGPAATDAHLKAVLAFRPRVIYGYPSALALLARHAATLLGPRDFPWLRLVVMTGEEITPAHLSLAREVFGCAVASEYGSREVGLIAHDCPHGSLHVMSPHLYVEVAVNGKAVAPGQVGEIICTTLTTRGQPFVRYRLGDVGVLVPGACACGLPLPRMRIEGGRVTGFVVLPDGRLCHGAVSSYALREEPGIVEFKTYQRAIDRFEVLLVVDPSFDRGAIARIQHRYRALFGPHVRVTCRIVDRIPPDPSGKRRHVVSEVAADSADFQVADALEAQLEPLEPLR